MEKISAITLAIIFGGVLLHAPISVGMGVLFPEWHLVIKSWKEILMLGLIPLACITVTKRGMWKSLAGDWIFRLVVAYALLHGLLFIVSSYDFVQRLAGLAIDLRYILFFALVYVLVKAIPQYRSLFAYVGTAGAFLVVGFATLQFFLPPDILAHLGYSQQTIMPYLTVDRNPDYVRVNSTLRGPNPLGAYAGIVLALLVAAAVRLRDRLNSNTMLGGIILFVCSLVALWLSYSRSAAIGAAVAIGIVLGVTVLRKLSKKAWIISSVVLFALLGALLAGRDSSFVSNVLLHENPSGGSSVSSNDGHAESLRDGALRLVSQPFGAGIGSTGSASLSGPAPVIIENQFFFIAHEAGWLGIILFVAIFVAIMIRLWKKRADWLALGVFASGVGLSIIGILLPVWADDTVSVVWWGLAATVLAGGAYGRKTTKQKTA